MARVARESATKVPQRSPDEIRRLVLEFLYEHHRKARGALAVEIGFRDLHRKMKERHGLSQQEVASNLDYLVQKEWVRRVETPRAYTTPYGTTQSSERVTFKISDIGIDLIEGDSEFNRTSPYGGVNISNVQGVVVLGNQNSVIQNKFESLATELGQLRREVATSPLSDEDKVAVIAEIQTVESQLAKREPNRSIIQQAWASVEKVVTVGSLAELGAKVGRLIASLVAQGGLS